MPSGTKTPAGPRAIAIMREIDRERHERGFSQAMLADAVGISDSQVSRILSGQRPATVPEVLALCEALDISLAEVARRAGE
jgi:transcriptional regulator with XRE-family HTH domain